uniref:Uncharacterized protein LOC105032623 n=1 Tax=Elaeis guineensis var. tenera TaxID=51953 RepID=A0A6I9QA74_ELAGV|nr:uncharacterized protein LOC105032623 [Elaeis guineensis]
MATSSNQEAMQVDATSPTILVEKNPPQSRFLKLGINSWPKWGCPPGKFHLKFDAEEICYLLKGKVKAYIKGSSECVDFTAGDLVVIPRGVTCTWHVLVPVDKHYKFESTS